MMYKIADIEKQIRYYTLFMVFEYYNNNELNAVCNVRSLILGSYNTVHSLFVLFYSRFGCKVATLSFDNIYTDVSVTT